MKGRRNILFLLGLLSHMPLKSKLKLSNEKKLVQFCGCSAELAFLDEDDLLNYFKELAYATFLKGFHD